MPLGCKHYESSQLECEPLPTTSHRPTAAFLSSVLVACFVQFFVAGCASDTYHYGLSRDEFGTRPVAGRAEHQILIGGPRPCLDRIEKVVQSPRRWIGRLFRRPKLSAELKQQRRQEAIAFANNYFTANGIPDVNIDVRVYAPKLQWQRIAGNPHIAPVWRFTGGTASWLRYTLLPMRVLNSDRYDPFSNTLHLNSTRPLRALYESASAKEYHTERELAFIKIGKGTYAMLQYVPFVPLLHDWRASSDVLTYAATELEPEAEKKLYPVVYSRLGATAVSETISVVGLSPNAPFFTAPLLRVAGSVTGRVTGKAASREYSKPNRIDGQETF